MTASDELGRVAWEGDAAAVAARGAVLLALARAGILEAFGGPAPTPPREAWLAAVAATFVTLRTGLGELRGCIGTLEAYRPLGEDVVANARAAAFGDPRFPPVGEVEIARLRVEVSLLTPPEPLAAASEEELLAVLRPGVDGLLLARGARRATFLTQVWEELTDPREFLRHLQRKAGLPPGWEPGTAAWRYQVRKWQEARGR